jgi:hypothetical protein
MPLGERDLNNNTLIISGLPEVGQGVLAPLD